MRARSPLLPLGGSTIRANIEDGVLGDLRSLASGLVLAKESRYRSSTRPRALSAVPCLQSELTIYISVRNFETFLEYPMSTSSYFGVFQF
jgi:hypothetical protein